MKKICIFSTSTQIMYHGISKVDIKAFDWVIFAQSEDSDQIRFGQSGKIRRCPSEDISRIGPSPQIAPPGQARGTEGSYE